MKMKIFLRKVFAKMYFNAKVKQADKAWLYTGKKHYVIPNDKFELEVINREGIKDYNKKYGTNLTALDLENMAYYITSTGTTGKRNKKSRKSLHI